MPSSKDQIEKKMDEFKKLRKEKQPLEYPSAGSVFKRPPGHFAGQLIEQCGLKGYKIGGAMVSDKHAGFIINYDNATANDVIRLIEHIKDEVLKKFNVQLECEIKTVGNFT
jgi:UDP-N-acetylmuramate dehydrogenase